MTLAEYAAILKLLDKAIKLTRKKEATLLELQRRIAGMLP
jgi:hypothetical protein